MRSLREILLYVKLYEMRAMIAITQLIYTAATLSACLSNEENSQIFWSSLIGFDLARSYMLRDTPRLENFADKINNNSFCNNNNR